jgi:hypothetical protein
MGDIREGLGDAEGADRCKPEGPRFAAKLLEGRG